MTWRNWSDIRRSFASADLVGNCVVFNIGGNKFRLVTRIFYPSHKVFVLKVMTHKEYGTGKWKSECGCFSDPPAKRRKT